MKLPDQTPIAFDPQVAIFGAWRLGFEWMHVTLGNSRPVLGLGLYVRKASEDESHVFLSFGIKEAVAFAERCKLPPRRFAELMGYAIQHAKERTYKPEELLPWT